MSSPARLTGLSGAALWFACVAFAAGAAAAPTVPRFSDQSPGPPADWMPVNLAGISPADFRVVEIAGERVLEATADAAAGALAVRFAEPLDDIRRVRWRWRIENHIDGADITSRAGDDYPARLYVTFARDPAELPLATRARLALARLVTGQPLPTAALCYVWDATAPVGTAVPNAYTDTIRMIVTDSGGAVPSGWHEHNRDIRADYRAAFGTAPPPVSAVLVGIDTDNTGEDARAWFGDIELLPLVSGPDSQRAD